MSKMIRIKDEIHTALKTKASKRRVSLKSLVEHIITDAMSAKGAK